MEPNGDVSLVAQAADARHAMREMDLAAALRQGAQQRLARAAREST